MFNLNGRKALITGASGTIGEAIARYLHRQGAYVGLHGTNREKLQALAEQLQERVFVFSADLSDSEQLKELALSAEKEMAGVDILVNNAGITCDNLLVRMRDEDWDRVLLMNLTAVFRLTRMLVQPMIRRRYGRIINISSIVGVTGNAGQTNYCASKAGLIGFSKALAKEIATRHVTVNAIAPGFIESAMTNKLTTGLKTALTEQIPMKHIGKGEDIAAAVVYLSSDEASYITGETLHINGGMAMI